MKLNMTLLNNISDELADEILRKLREATNLDCIKWKVGDNCYYFNKDGWKVSVIEDGEHWCENLILVLEFNGEIRHRQHCQVRDSCHLNSLWCELKQSIQRIRQGDTKSLLNKLDCEIRDRRSRL